MEKPVEEHGIFKMDVPPPEEKPKLSLSDQLELERKEWTSKVNDLVYRMKNIHGLVSLQVDVLSQQQIAIEKKTFYMTQHSKMRTVHDKKRGEKLEHFTVKYDRKLSAPEKDALVVSSLADLTEDMEHISTQVEFFYETIRNISNIIYGLKLRVGLEDFQKQS